MPRQRGQHPGERRQAARPARLARAPVVAVVGAGASGTLAAVHLLRRPDTRVLLFDPNPPGRGVAYSTTDRSHLLNVRAGAMSGLEDEPGDFVAWCRARGLDVCDGDFVPRALYGEYLEGLLARFACGRLEVVRARVENVDEALFHGQVRVTLQGGRSLPADFAVLALGVNRPAPLALPGLGGTAAGIVVDDPWAPGALERISRAGTVAIVGTGLTAVDVALTVCAAHPHSRVVAVSRRGLMPRAHLASSPAAAAVVPRGASLDEILEVVGTAVAADPGAWRGVVDGLRPRTSEMWRSLRPHERERFDRELRVYWDVHRHRMAPEVSSRVEALVAAGRLEFRAGGVRYEGALPGPRARLMLGDGSSLDADLLVNATGPARSLVSPAEPLVGRLLARGDAVADELGIGLATSAAGALIDFEGVASRRCFTLGPPRRGELLESTAVPEIRQQAAGLALLLGGTPDLRMPAALADAA